MVTETILERYLDALLKGDRRSCRAVIEETMQTGVPANSVYINVIWPIMVEIEKLFAQDRISPIQQHLAVRINRTIVDQLQNKLPHRPGNTAPWARTGAALLASAVQRELRDSRPTPARQARIACEAQRDERRNPVEHQIARGDPARFELAREAQDQQAAVHAEQEGEEDDGGDRVVVERPDLRERQPERPQCRRQLEDQVRADFARHATLLSQAQNDLHAGRVSLPSAPCQPALPPKLVQRAHVFGIERLFRLHRELGRNVGLRAELACYGHMHPVVIPRRQVNGRELAVVEGFGSLGVAQ